MGFGLPDVGKYISRQWGTGPTTGAGAEAKRFGNRFFGSDDLPDVGRYLGGLRLDPQQAGAGALLGYAINPYMAIPGAIAGGLASNPEYARALDYMGRYPGRTANDALRGKDPLTAQKERDKAEAKAQAQALAQARQIMMMLAGSGVRGGAQVGAGIGASNDYMAAFKQQQDAIYAQQDAQTQQMLQQLMMLGAFL